MAGDVEQENPAEEDDMRSAVGVKSLFSDVEEDEIPFRFPGAALRRTAYAFLDEVGGLG